MSFTHQLYRKGPMKKTVFSSPKKLISSFHALFQSHSPAVVFPSTRSDSRDSLGSSVCLAGINEVRSERVSFQGNSLDLLPADTLSCYSADDEDPMEVLDMDEEAVHDDYGNTRNDCESVSVDKSAFLSSDDVTISSNNDDGNRNGNIDDAGGILNVVDVVDTSFIQIIPVKKSFRSISRAQKFRLENPLPVSPRDRLESDSLPPVMLLRHRMKRFNKVHDSHDRCVV